VTNRNAAPAFSVLGIFCYSCRGGLTTRSAAIFLIFLAVALSSAQATPASIEGSWRGSRIVTYRNGADNVQCRVRNTRLTPKSFALSSHARRKAAATGRLVNVGGNRYTGWVQQGNQSGRASLVQHGNRLSITVTSRQGLAQLTLARLG
jgi:hypothetical protein